MVNNEDPTVGSMSASARWIANKSGRRRPVGKVKGKRQWDYFDSEIIKFQTGSAATHDNNFSSIDYGGFTVSWNNFVDKCVTDGANYEFTYKNESLLKDAMKSSKKYGNKVTTLL